MMQLYLIICKYNAFYAVTSRLRKISLFSESYHLVIEGIYSESMNVYWKMNRSLHRIKRKCT